MASFQRLLITGGAGFIGSAYVRQRLRRAPGSPIRVLDALTYAGDRAHLAGLEGDVELVVGDVADAAVVAAAMEGCDGVVHFAAESHVDRSMLDAAPFERTNVQGTQVLLDACAAAGVKRLLFVSTDEVYGDVSGAMAASKETDTLNPGNPYASSKARAEHFVTAAGEAGLDVVITRGANTCGPRQYPEKIVPLFITNAMLGLPLPVYGDGSAVRDYLHVDDHCSGIDLVLETAAAGSIYNLGSRMQMPCGDVAEHILDLLPDTGASVEFVSDRPDHDMRYDVDPQQVEALGWSPRHDFKSTLRATVDWYVRHESWWRPIRNGEHFKKHFRAWYVDRQF